MITLGRPPIAIDILSSTTGLRFKEAWAGRTTVLIDGRRIGFLGMREYVKTKRACGRPKDLLDIELLREAGLLEGLKVPRARSKAAAAPKSAKNRKSSVKPKPATTRTVRRRKPDK